MRAFQGWGSVGWLAVLLGVMLSGCAVPQRAGRGQAMHCTEPEMKTGYWLYLPEDYVARKGHNVSSGRWPVVVTFHGMIPYDTAGSQIREWQEEADRYGLIVIAPELRTCNSLMQYPLTNPNLSYVRDDSRAVLLVMDKVFRETNADPGRVLATSFSCGGYLAHYFMNRYPERFSCLAVHGSNFSTGPLQTAQIPKYRHKPIGIYFGQNDSISVRESMEAVRWYRQFNFVVEAKEVQKLGHERRPQLAAALFARSAGLTAKTPPNLSSLVLRDVQTPDVTPLAIGSTVGTDSPLVLPRQSSTAWMPLEKVRPTAGPSYTTNHNDRPMPSPQPVSVQPSPAQQRTLSPTVSGPNPGPTPKRPLPQPYDGQSDKPEGRPFGAARHSGDNLIINSGLNRTEAK